MKLAHMALLDLDLLRLNIFAVIIDVMTFHIVS